MPGDTLHINNKAQQQNTYDAIVIGSGISGGWAAKELTENGLKVLMLERGRNFEHIKDYKSAIKRSMGISTSWPCYTGRIKTSSDYSTNMGNFTNPL